jgi:diacylglycerol O-acyltransferase / wax synthase
MSKSTSAQRGGAVTPPVAAPSAHSGNVQSMSAIDRAWLLMDHPTNPMLIVVLIVLRGALTRARLYALLAERFLIFERFRCIPAAGPMGAGSWIESSQFELTDHVHCMALPAGSGQRELEAMVGELASTPLSTARPLWSFHLIDNYAGGCALVVRMHHCYADGVALLQVLQTLADEGGPTVHDAAAVASSRAAPQPPGLLQQLLRDGAGLLETGLHYALHPLEAGSAARTGVDLASELALIGLMADDPPTRLKAALSGVKRTAWGSLLALEEVKTIGRLLGCTVNDVLVSVLAGALGRYLESHGDTVSGLTLRAVVPFNLRTSAPEPALGNYFGLVFVELPVGIRHPLERLYAVHASMGRLKASPQALLTLGLLATIGSLPPAVEPPAIALFSAKASLVASNLPGPTEALHLGGAPITQLLFWVPQSGDIGTGVSMLTYCGQVQLGVIADRQLIADPGELVDGMATEFDRLVFLVLLGAGSLSD